MTAEHTEWAVREEALSKLAGARLASVQFVMDYLILGFDARGALTTLVWPKIMDGNDKLCFGMDGYRDKLCSLIEKVVKTATIDHDESIRVDFDSGIKMIVPLKSYEGHGERAILTGPKHFLLVF